MSHIGKIFWTLTLAMSSAQAAPYTYLRANTARPISGKGTDIEVFNTPPPDDHTAKPIRTAKTRAVINKMVTKQAKDGGGFEISFEKVCTLEFESDVFDLRNTRDEMMVIQNQHCESTVDGKPVQVGIGSLVYFNKTSILNDGLDDELKTTTAFLWISPTSVDTPAVQQGQNSSFSTKTLALDSFILSLTPDTVICTSSGTIHTQGSKDDSSPTVPGPSPAPLPACSVLPEAFSATISIEDKQ